MTAPDGSEQGRPLPSLGGLTFCVTARNRAVSKLLKSFGRPSVTEIELGQSLKDNWHLVVNWLQGLSMLKDAGIKGTFLPD
jgi:hypothetical protein